MNTAIIVAAGSGKRFSSDVPKQFVEILGKPILIHTLERFELCPAIDEIVLILSEAGREEFVRICGRYRISKLTRIVTGGETRAESVRNGLKAIKPSADHIVAVHDGARPLVTVDEISQTVAKASETGAACLVAIVTDTIKDVEGQYISHTVDRSRLRRAMTPQAFRYDLLVQAFDGKDFNEMITDECYLVEKLGVKIAFVEGSSWNIKITRPEDVIVAEAFLGKA